VKGTGRIVGYAVNRKAISVKIEMAGSATIIDELERYKGKPKTVRLDTFQLVGKIESITISRNVGFLMHVARLDFINRRLFRLMEKDPLTIEVSTPQLPIPPTSNTQSVFIRTVSRLSVPGRP